MQLTMYRTYSSDFVSEAGYTKNRIQYTDVNKWAVLFTETIIMGVTSELIIIHQHISIIMHRQRKDIYREDDQS